MSERKAPPDGPQKTGRVDAVDCARGLALIGMAAYHLTWDLADFRFVSPMFPFSPPMRLFSHVVASAFLALVGVSLALAHRDRLNLPAFWRRLAIVAGAAALVTGGSLIFAPAQGIWFGILHCIAAASLVALPFVEAPAWASLFAGATAIVLPFFIHSTLFDPPALLWLGLGEALPSTLDWRPLLPWAGVVPIGLGLARLPGVLPRLTSPWRWRAKSGPARGVCFAGRHSLAVYLVHQPILIGLVAAAAASGLLATNAPPKPDYRAFLGACERACVAHGRAAEDCGSACRCVADAVERSGQAERLGELDAERNAELKRMADACMGRRK
ncbi:MAG TPA: heparan-alpha-glucosaminide N-acetyltransferase [Roseiarcus sp.]|nr:heparan-alpha-glucosaminide N-acetyltransferase [Roseiarcus sp.]